MLHVGAVSIYYDIATGCELATEGFESRYGKKFSLLHIVETGSPAYETSFPEGTGDSVFGGKAAVS
jgi:hypothetical protein